MRPCGEWSDNPHPQEIRFVLQDIVCPPTDDGGISLGQVVVAAQRLTYGQHRLI